MAQDCNYFGPFGLYSALWGVIGPSGPYMALKNDHRGRGSVHAKFQLVSLVLEPFRDQIHAFWVSPGLSEPSTHLSKQHIVLLG